VQKLATKSRTPMTCDADTLGSCQLTVTLARVVLTLMQPRDAGSKPQQI